MRITLGYGIFTYCNMNKDNSSKNINLFSLVSVLYKSEAERDFAFRKIVVFFLINKEVSNSRLIMSISENYDYAKYRALPP